MVTLGPAYPRGSAPTPLMALKGSLRGDDEAPASVACCGFRSKSPNALRWPRVGGRPPGVDDVVHRGLRRHALALGDLPNTLGAERSLGVDVHHLSASNSRELDDISRRRALLLD